MSEYQALIALGSNLAKPVEQLKGAIACLKKNNAIAIVAVSHFYRTAPVGYANQPDFINAAICVQTSLTPMGLLRVLNQIEDDFGRVRTFQNAPRTLDLDLIDYAEQIWNTERLILPHPRAHERGFVLQPLSDMVPKHHLGQYGRIEQLLQQVDVSDIECLADLAWE